MFIDNFDTQKNVLIIAEIGNNHEGNRDVAKDLIHLAAKAGANAVKFQTIIPEKLISICQPDRLKQLAKYALSYDDFIYLHDVALSEKLIFLSTPFDIDSVRFLSSLVPALKTSSGDNTFYPLLKESALTGKPLIISTGLSSFEEIKRTKMFIESVWEENGIKSELAFLHCVSCYPTPLNAVNLNAIVELKQLGVTVGYSDHTIGIDAPIIAVALGARIIEKHFTLSNEYSNFRDHKLSANPDDFATMVKKIRDCETMLAPLSKELKVIQDEATVLLRRSIAAARNINKGDSLCMEDITWLRPGTGIPPGKEDLCINKRVLRDIKKGEIILEEDIE